MRHVTYQPSPAQRSTIAASHVAGRAGLVDEHQLRRIEA